MLPEECTEEATVTSYLAARLDYPCFVPRDLLMHSVQALSKC